MGTSTVLQCPVCQSLRIDLYPEEVEVCQHEIYVMMRCDTCESTWKSTYLHAKMEYVTARGPYAPAQLFDHEECVLSQWETDEKQLILTDGHGNFAVGYAPQVHTERTHWHHVAPAVLQARADARWNKVCATWQAMRSRPLGVAPWANAMGRTSYGRE